MIDYPWQGFRTKFKFSFFRYEVKQPEDIHLVKTISHKNQGHRQLLYGINKIKKFEGARRRVGF